MKNVTCSAINESNRITD